MLESKIERDTCKKAREALGVFSAKFISDGSTGFPDRIFFIPGGRPLFIEFKTKVGRLSPKQNYIHEQLRLLGYNVEVHNDTNTAIKAIQKYLDTARLSK